MGQGDRPDAFPPRNTDPLRRDGDDVTPTSGSCMTEKQMANDSVVY